MRISMGEDLSAVLMTSFGLTLWANNPLLVLSATLESIWQFDHARKNLKAKTKTRSVGLWHLVPSQPGFRGQKREELGASTCTSSKR